MANLTVDSVAAGKVAELKQGTSLTVEVDEAGTVIGLHTERWPVVTARPRRPSHSWRPIVNLPAPTVTVSPAR